MITRGVAGFLATATGPVALREALRRATEAVPALARAPRAAQCVASRIPESILGGDLVALMGGRMRALLRFWEAPQSVFEGDHRSREPSQGVPARQPTRSRSLVPSELRSAARPRDETPSTTHRDSRSRRAADAARVRSHQAADDLDLLDRRAARRRTPADPAAPIAATRVASPAESARPVEATRARTAPAEPTSLAARRGRSAALQPDQPLSTRGGSRGSSRSDPTILADGDTSIGAPVADLDRAVGRRALSWADDRARDAESRVAASFSSRASLLAVRLAEYWMLESRAAAAPRIAEPARVTQAAAAEGMATPDAVPVALRDDWPLATGREVGARAGAALGVRSRPTRRSLPSSEVHRGPVERDVADAQVEVRNVFNITVGREGAGGADPLSELSDRIAEILREQAVEHGIDVT